MLCHPNKIKQLPEFKRFREIDEELQKIWAKKLRLEKEQRSAYFKDKKIFVIPPACSRRCHYWWGCKNKN